MRRSRIYNTSNLANFQLDLSHISVFKQRFNYISFFMETTNPRLLQRRKWDVRRRARDIHKALGWRLNRIYLTTGIRKRTDPVCRT